MQVRWKAKQLRLNMAARLGRDVLQVEVSQATGLSVSRLSAIENGHAEGVEFATLVKLATFYGVTTIGELLEFVTDSSDKERVGNHKPTMIAT